MIERLRAMFCDHLLIMRGKYLAAHKMRDDESRFARPTFAVHYDKDLILDARHTKCRKGIPDMALRRKAGEIREGWEPDTKVVLGNLYCDDMQPLPLCPRGALKRAVADWKRHGLKPKVGIERRPMRWSGRMMGRSPAMKRPVAWPTAPATSANHIAMLDVTEAERTAASRLSCQIRMGATLNGIVPRVPQP